MATEPSKGGVRYDTSFEKGRLHQLDAYMPGDHRIGPAIKAYSDYQNSNRLSVHWQRAVRWIENIFFSNGRQYINDILTSTLANSSQTSVGDLSIVTESVRNIPTPTNDLIGRFVETNVALLTENNPRPRITAKSDRDEDLTAAELSEYTLEYLWEALYMPEKHRELARMIMNMGISFLEVCYDPTVPRRVYVPKTETSTDIEWPPGAEQVTPMKVERIIPVIDKSTGKPVIEDKIEYGDITANVISPFQVHFPPVHYWRGQDLGWIMKEEFFPIDMIKDKYQSVPQEETGLTKRNGWDLSILDKLKEESITSLALWWWQRISELVEGPGPSLYIGSPQYWEGYAIVRTFDRKPCRIWPKGRTIITVGDDVLYDSPKKIGARAYDTRWPERWHPYIRYSWENQTGSIYARSLVAKLLPCLKRINHIDTTQIMWRRTVPIATWTAPKGSKVVEDQWGATPGRIWEYDARKTNTHRPEPVYPPPYPASAIEERNIMLAQMESIAGTEQILRGERPVGVNSAMMIDILRKQALASRSAILQAWDESLQEEGALLLQNVIRHVRNDARYAERIRILARERDYSSVSIEQFSGTDLSDNVIVRVDTASLALVSKEARQARMVEVLQYLPNLMAVEDIGMRQAMLNELDLKKALMPQGPDINRAKKTISLIKNNRVDRIFMMPEDDPYIFHAILTNEMKSDGFLDLGPNQQAAIIQLVDVYERQIKLREMAQQQAMEAQAMLMMASKGGQGQ